MRLSTSPNLLPKIGPFALAVTLTLAAGIGCAGVKQMETPTGTAGTGGSGASGGSGGTSGSGGTTPPPVVPIMGSHTCADYDTSGGCASFSTSTESSFGGTPSGSTTIAYPLNNALFPYNLGPIQVQMTTPGSAARITFKTLDSSNVDVDFYGSCEPGPGNGCSVTIPLVFTQKLAPACRTEDIQLTASVLNNSGTPTADSAPVMVAWAESPLTGGLYFWTVIPNAKEQATPTPGQYVLLDTAQNPPNGTAIQRYDFSQDKPAPQIVWTDDGGPGGTMPYAGAPQAWDNGAAGGHCIGCHSITNDGKYMGLTIGGSSTTNAANWEMLDIQNQTLLLSNPTKTGGNGCNDPNASPTVDPTCYWESYRKDVFATETSWGPNGDVMVSMYNSGLYFNTVAVSGTSATATRQGLAFPTSAAKIDPYQSDPFWSHDGSLFAYTSFNQSSPNGGTNGDLKLNGQIVIADATQETVTDDAHVLVGRGSNLSNYYPCISEDSAYVVFNQSTCGSGNDPSPLGGGYGIGSCDGYDDASAELWFVPSSGGGTTRLDNANGIINGNVINYDNSWPRFSPDVGSFRGQKLYWVAFSSRRPYGVQANTGGITSTQPQLWFAGVAVGEVNVGDPSYAAVWLPGQNPMGNATLYGNHVPQWVKVAIVIDPGI